jgi:hypothetical protein
MVRFKHSSGAPVTDDLTKTTAYYMQSYAFVTPTFWRDLTRCELLAESLDRCAPDIPHYLIVDRRERPLFAHLDRGRRKIIESESLLEASFWRVPGKSGWWLSYKTPPVRGWIMQQIKKIAATKAIPEQTLVFCDSDTAFFRRLKKNDLLVDGKIGLLDVGFVNEDIRRWTAESRRLLGVPASKAEYRNHVGYLVCWNRGTVEALQQRIELSTKVSWQVALARTLSFSEYMLYGIFVREVVGYTAAEHTPSNIPLIKAVWNDGSALGTAIDGIFSDLDPRTIGIMVHSKDGIDPNQFRHELERRWANLD